MRADGALDQDGNSEGDEVIFLRETNRISSWMRYGGEGISEREELRMRSWGFCLEQRKRVAINWA